MTRKCLMFLLLLGPIVLTASAIGQDDSESSASIVAKVRNVVASVQAPTKQLALDYKLDTRFYKKHIDVDGFPILSSDKVCDFALIEAKWIIQQMLSGRPDILRAINANKIRLTIMAPQEMTTDVPEHSTLTPAAYWDKRARGLGATLVRPTVSCGEENLLEYEGDPYRAENILVHEFGHVIHQHGLNLLDGEFDKRLRKMYNKALAEGLWKDKYAGSNHSEYFAESVQSWFGTNRENDNDHNHVNTRAELREYDPPMGNLMEAIFGDNDWQYVRPSQRKPVSEHLNGYDMSRAPHFQWPAHVSKAFRDHESGKNLKRLENKIGADWSEAKSSGGGKAVEIKFRNKTKRALRIQWIDNSGKRLRYGTIAPGRTHLQNTYAGHLWELSYEDGQIVGQFKTTDSPCWAEVK